MRRFRSQLVCFSITCNPLIADDQKTSKKTSSFFSHALLWCRLKRESVLQLYRVRTCSKAIGIQYHSDKDTTTLSFAESGEAFGCLVALRQSSVIIKTVFVMSSEKSWYKLSVILFGRITELMLKQLTRARLAQLLVQSHCDCSSAEHEFLRSNLSGKSAKKVSFCLVSVMPSSKTPCLRVLRKLPPVRKPVPGWQADSPTFQS